MNIPPQPPSSEEIEPTAALHSSEEMSTLPEPVSDSLAEETEPTDALHSSEEVSTLPEPVSDSLAEETEPTDESSSELDGAEASILDEDEDFEPLESPSQPLQSGVFIRKGLLIAAASALLVIVLLVGLLVFINRPKDPPTDWIASSTPSAGSSTGKTLYYLHWANQNGDLTGQMQLSANVNNVPQSLTAVTTGLYNRDNHIIYVIVTIDGQPNTLTGKINDNNDTLTLNLAGATSQSSQIVFHTGNAADYKQAVKKLGSKA